MLKFEHCLPVLNTERDAGRKFCFSGFDGAIKESIKSTESLFKLDNGGDEREYLRSVVEERSTGW